MARPPPTSTPSNGSDADVERVYGADRLGVGNEGPAKRDWEASRKMPECGAHCEHVHGDQAPTPDELAIDSLKRQVADLTAQLAGSIATSAALRRERDSLRVRLQAQSGLLARYDGIAEAEFLGPCVHGRDPFDRCDADDVPTGVVPCGELRGWQAAQRVEREACAVEAEKWLNRPRCKATAIDIAAAIRDRGGA